MFLGLKSAGLKWTPSAHPGESSFESKRYICSIRAYLYRSKTVLDTEIANESYGELDLYHPYLRPRTADLSSRIILFDCCAFKDPVICSILSIEITAGESLRSFHKNSTILNHKPCILSESLRISTTLLKCRIICNNSNSVSPAD